MRGYPVNLRKDGKFILVTFPDIPEAITQGNDRDHALEMAKEALEVAMDFYFEDQRPVPAPSKPRRGQAVVELPVSVAAKVFFVLNPFAILSPHPFWKWDETRPGCSRFENVSNGVESADRSADCHQITDRHHRNHG